MSSCLEVPLKGQKIYPAIPFWVGRSIQLYFFNGQRIYSVVFRKFYGASFNRYNTYPAIIVPPLTGWILIQLLQVPCLMIKDISHFKRLCKVCRPDENEHGRVAYWLILDTRISVEVLSWRRMKECNASMYMICANKSAYRHLGLKWMGSSIFNGTKLKEVTLSLLLSVYRTLHPCNKKKKSELYLLRVVTSSSAQITAVGNTRDICTNWKSSDIPRH